MTCEHLQEEGSHDWYEVDDLGWGGRIYKRHECMSCDDAEGYTSYCPNCLHEERVPMPKEHFFRNPEDDDPWDGHGWCPGCELYFMVPEGCEVVMEYSWLNTALINGDTSGFDDDRDHQELKGVLAFYDEYEFVDTGYETEFGKPDSGGLHGDVLAYLISPKEDR